MIVLITGDFGVGKDTFADMLNEDFGEESVKIQSYTTREKRYNTEDTHIFVDKFTDNGDIVAYTEIEGCQYWTRRNQFGTAQYDIYVVDDIGIREVLAANIDDTFIIEIQRPRELINVSDLRLNRRRTDFYQYKADAIVRNDTDSLESLFQVADQLCTYIKKIDGEKHE